MAVRDPRILPFHGEEWVPARRTHEWFEIKLDEFKVQKKLPCFVDGDTFWVEPQVWYQWHTELVEYFICNGHTGSEIEAFIKDHALGGPGKVR